MAISFVQHASATGNGVSSVTVNLGSVSTSGNCLILNAATPNDTTISSITLNGSSDHWAQQVPNSTFGAYQWADPNCGAGTAVVVNFSGTEIPAVDVFEFSGLLTSSPLDKDATDGSAGTGAAWSSGTTSSLSQAAEVLVAFAGGYNAANTNPTITPPGTWVSTTVLVPSTAVWQQSGYQIVGTASTYSYTGTSNMTGTNNEYGALIGTYKAAASVSAAAALSAAGALTPAGVRHATGTSAITAAGALTATTPKQAIGSAVIAAAAALGGAGAKAVAGSGAVAAAGVMSLSTVALETIYYGSFTRGYLQYTDLSTGLTLVAVPGHAYTIAVASGWTGLSVPPSDGNWSEVPPEPADAMMASRFSAQAPAHFTARDKIRWRQRQVIQAAHARMAARSR
ncbi:MAG TPA: hypothetical protein VMD51_07275 [Mycobacterium sp.]|nr:hypothetical protein [Mycobacterium sp.]